MKLDASGVLIRCGSCNTTNRVRFAQLGRPARCSKCHADLPLPASPIDVDNAAQFDAAVSASPIPIVVDFWASWCAPCRMVAPEIAKVATNRAGQALFLKVDTDANPELSSRFQIQSIPTIAIFHHGRVVNRASGVKAAPAIEAMIPG